MRTMLAAAVTLVVSAGSLGAAAQSISVNRIEISSDAAHKLVEACVAYAERNKVLVGAAVVGIDGVLIDFHLMQGATATNSETAILKAKTAAHWRRPTRELEEWVKKVRGRSETCSTKPRRKRHQRDNGRRGSFQRSPCCLSNSSSRSRRAGQDSSSGRTDSRRHCRRASHVCVL